ncbi:MFS transporter [Sulfurisoma sediminicola]|uniref:Lysosomal dipeptide transporter MFSD1 n=1 Tax=Sulfurisoma sediminicola TaxID=1381557 RepID=A0A497XJU3_9PROT|nr:MFS transporter [Sulfurisoma sediminicola]RLJ68144.1 sugar phosphate permease [Sulfurisoma sediminicola]
MIHPPARLAWAIWGLGSLVYLIAFFQRVAPAVMTDQLMAEFAIGGAALGNLSAFYFYAYVAMQIPTGLLADRWGPRRLLALGTAVAAVGGALFALAPSLAWAGAGRLLVGASIGVGFVSMLKLSSHWIAPRQFALVSGLLLLTGLVGGVGAGVPLRLLVDAYGWRDVMAAFAALTAALAVALWLFLRDDPEERGYASHFHGKHDAPHEHAPILHSLAEVLSYRNIWLLALVPVGFSGAVLTFAGLWGVPWLRQVHGLEPKAAAAITSVMLVAWGIGGPLLGALSTRSGRRKPLYFTSGIVAAAGWAAVIWAPLSLPALVVLLAITGLASGNIIIGFAWAKESVPLRLMGTASGVANMGPLMGGMFLQPAVGWMLDRHWSGTLANGARIYDAAAYQAGFALLFVTVAVALVGLLFARESHCRQAA